MPPSGNGSHGESKLPDSMHCEISATTPLSFRVTCVLRKYNLQALYATIVLHGVGSKDVKIYLLRHWLIGL